MKTWNVLAEGHHIRTVAERDESLGSDGVPPSYLSRIERRKNEYSRI